ncbi:MAG: alpha/beta fold hydrolase [Planctomycetota bacterium]|jgi:proline iminopeptidase
MEGHFEGADGLRLFYRRDGAAGNGSVIALHGGPGMDGAYLAEGLRPLERIRSVAVHDQRGGGRSDLPADDSLLTLARNVSDVERLREHLGLSRCTLIGHSWGALLAAAYAIAHPGRTERMVFLGPLPPRQGDMWARHHATVAERLSADQLEELRRLPTQIIEGRDPVTAYRRFWKVALAARLADPTRADDLSARFGHAPPDAIRYAMARTNPRTMESVGAWDLRQQLAHVDAPTLILHGEAETIPMDLVEEWTTSLPHARLVRVPDAAHFPHIERPDIVWPEIEALLNTPARAPPA